MVCTFQMFRDTVALKKNAMVILLYNARKERVVDSGNCSKSQCCAIQKCQEISVEWVLKEERNLVWSGKAGGWRRDWAQRDFGPEPRTRIIMAQT